MSQSTFDPATLYGDEPEKRPDLPEGFMKPDAEFEARKGSHIGSGVGRNVYEVKDNPDADIKESKDVTPAPNWLEYFIWSAVRGTAIEAKFGQLLGISESGRFLMMERLSDLDDAEYESTPAPPTWLNDVKKNAFGRNADGKIRIRDYGAVEIGNLLASAPTRLAGWQTTRKRLGIG